MAMANTNGGKTTGKKLTKDQAKLAQVVQRIGAVDKKPAKAGKAPLRPGSKGTTMVKQEVPFGGIGKAAFKVAEKVANTKPVVAATKAVARQVAKKDLKNTKKAVNVVADMQAKTKAEKIAKNSVKVVKPEGKLSNANKNIKSNTKVQDAKAGDTAKRDASNVKQSKPAKVVKINSAPKKKGK